MRVIAQMIVAQAKAIAPYSARIANKLLGLANAISSFDNSELTVEVKENKLDVKFTPKDSVPDFARDDFYKNGCMYFEDHPLPIHIRRHDDLKNYEVEQGNRYEVAMRTKVVEDAYSRDAAAFDMTDKILIVIGAIMTLNLIAMVFLLG